MDIQAANRAIRRAAAAARHAQTQLDAAPSDRARNRHARRLLNAMRAEKEARQTFSFLAMTDA